MYTVILGTTRLTGHWHTNILIIIWPRTQRASVREATRLQDWNVIWVFPTQGSFYSHCPLGYNKEMRIKILFCFTRRTQKIYYGEWWMNQWVSQSEKQGYFEHNNCYVFHSTCQLSLLLVFSTYLRWYPMQNPFNLLKVQNNDAQILLKVLSGPILLTLDIAQQTYLPFILKVSLRGL